MNKERMSALADFIEDASREVMMVRYTSGNSLKDADKADECGTAACIAGWCSIMNFEEWKQFRASCRDDDPIADFAQQWLGLSPIDRDALFFPYQTLGFAATVQKTRALEVLRGQRELTRQWLQHA